ncbi:methionine biosynthesis protein MetW [Polynucleobacter sp. SHI8]|uniref:methionine biosynthesis protein MetW n=1 Tax=unclassified Polynucleobacter TaxID=2640945 RepID=UPI0024910BA7|nr:MULTISPECIES: methionine biosynthesis protein MetW [unclassified Polynucleobacter]BDW12223.1 methionine biosynthesis protein MetW [Polynucleobacter sp. SHI2]BDW14671.1 methionine biosynthesis protein MetW [Polynucleobacter sp. SHI8]
MSTKVRADFSAIANWIQPHSSLLDLGCGDGDFLEYIRAQKKVQTYGVEISDLSVLACVEKGLDVIQQDLEAGLALFENQSFDMVLLSQTLQTIHETESILNEIVRVGKECVISFPNFAHWSHRIDILLGRMPVSKSLPFDWYNTPNVRVLTIADFEALASKIGIKILDRVILHEGKEISWAANLFGSLAIYRVQSA